MNIMSVLGQDNTLESSTFGIVLSLFGHNIDFLSSNFIAFSISFSSHKKIIVRHNYMFENTNCTFILVVAYIEK